jgi:ABC-type transporter Mla subunit MlaD
MNEHNKQLEEKEPSELMVPETKEVSELVPPMNVNLPAQQTQQSTELSNLVPDENLVGMFGEIIDDLRSNEKEIDGLINNFSEMVMHEGDATSASKEALVNLIKIKSELADKKTKVADLMTRIKLKSRDTFPLYLSAKQENRITIDKRQIIKDTTKNEKSH